MVKMVQMTLRDDHCSQGIRYMNCCAAKGEAYRPTPIEQLANCLTHSIWVMPAIYATYRMLQESHTLEQTFCAIVYGSSFVSLFTISTMFHVFYFLDDTLLLCKFFHLGDRFIIYIYIAASYTPWFLLQCDQHYGNSISTFIWLFAFTGVLYTWLHHEKYKMLETIIYLCHGFLPAAFLAQLSTKGFFDLACGGALYVIGVVFFKSDGRIPFAHALWHLFGSTAAWIHHYAIWTHLYQSKVATDI